MSDPTNITMSYDIHFAYEENINYENILQTTQKIPSTPININSLVEAKLMTYLEYRLSKSINYYGYIVEVVVGSVANILVLIIMLGLRHLPICNYMAALALADLFVLLGSCLIRWLNNKNIDLLTVNTAVCRILNFQSYSSFSLSAWLLVAMTVDRYIAITYPLKAIRLSTPRRARFVIAILMITMAAINFHFLIILVVETQPKKQLRMCLGYPRFNYFLNTMWPWIDATVYSFLPFTFLTIFNFLIIRSHIKSTIIHAALKGSNSTAMSVTACRVSRKITITLLIVTFTFILLTAPKVILMIIRPTVFNFKPTLTKVDYKILAQYSLTSNLVTLLMYTNHCVNFFLYVLTGHKFRQQLLNMFKCHWKPWFRCAQSTQAENCSTETNITNLRCKRSSTKEDIISIENMVLSDKPVHEQHSNSDLNMSRNVEEKQENSCTVWDVSGHRFSS